MDEERRRILRMMAEGTISVEECDELLRSLSDRRKEKTEKEVQAAQHESRPIWPYVLLVVLAIVVIPIFLAAFAGAQLGAGRFRIMLPFFSWLPGIFIFPPPLGPLRILLTIFWIWMIVDCLSRLPCDFRLLFTTQHKYDKWIWLAVVVITGWLGALAYFIIIRQPGRRLTPPSIKEKTSSSPKSTPPERPLRPSRRARSLMGLVIITIILTVSIPALIMLFLSVTHYPVRVNDELAALLIIPPILAIILIWSIFWVCMLISCLTRDYREFGTLITSDKSADKLVWVLLILFLPIIGAIAYHISIRRRPMAG